MDPQCILWRPYLASLDHPSIGLLHVKITQLDKCRIFLSIVVSVASSLQLSQVSQVVHKCRKHVQAYCHNDDTKEALKTSHVLGLEKENWLTEVKELLTPEKSSETKVLRVSAPLYQP
jgi:hypothetical protein